MFIGIVACNKSSENVVMGKSNHDTLMLVEDAYDYQIYVDRDTKVMYLWKTAYYKGGLTVMLNADGTPKLYQE